MTHMDEIINHIIQLYSSELISGEGSDIYVYVKLSDAVCNIR